MKAVKTLGTLILLVCLSGVLFGGKPLVEPQVRLSTLVDDPDLIRQVLTEQLLALNPAEVEFLEFVDLDGNGFGSGDIFVVHPGNSVYILNRLSPGLQEEMSGWKFASNQEVVAPAATRSRDLSPGNDPLLGLFSSILRILEAGYGSSPFSLELRRDSSLVEFRIWDYHPDSLHTLPPDIFSGGGVDLFQFQRIDTLYIADTVLYDVMYLVKEITDTLYVPVKIP